MSALHLDFGYPWWLSSAHLVLFLGLLAVAGVAWWLRWPTGWRLAILVVTAWAGAAAVLVRHIDINGVPPLPTERFLAGGTGRILDLGAGTGRSSIMVLAARPQATVVASDLFAASFSGHFGDNGRPQDRTWANLRAAGVADRASVETADMLKLPFADSTFDAAVSAYAMDHLGRDGGKQALAEARRVVKPGGQLLLILIENDAWAKVAFGPLLSHGGTYGTAWWRQATTNAGFTVEEEGTQPITVWFLLKRP